MIEDILEVAAIGVGAVVGGYNAFISGVTLWTARDDGIDLASARFYNFYNGTNGLYKTILFPSRVFCDFMQIFR